MALLNQSVQVYAQLPKLLERLRAGQAPAKFTREFLKDIGFKSSNHHAFIPLLKGLGFLTADGSPTQRYRDFLDATKSKKVIAEAISEVYSDVFVIKNKPTKSDKDLIAGKYKSTYNLSDISADRAARTFLALLDLADLEVLYASEPPQTSNILIATNETKEGQTAVPVVSVAPNRAMHMGLHYNIQIHLPATKDVEVYNAIFKSLRDHLIG